MAAPTITTGVLTGGSNSHATSSEEVNAVATDFVSEGIVGTFTNTSGVSPATGAFAVNATGTPDANINISTGIAYVQATPTSQNSQTLRVKCTVTGTLAISANASGSTKYDWIYISVSATNAANPAVGADNVATIVASRSTSASTDDGTPPTYGYPIAVVTVANGFTTITNGNIRDVRANSIVNLGSSSVSSGWLDLGYTPNTVTYNGNRSYSLVFNSVDLTSTVSNGMRQKFTRLVTAPTRCTSLNGTTQYYSKTSPNKLTFTDDFVVSAWVKLSSYPSGAAGVIASRYNGTSGWDLYVLANGQVRVIGFNAGAANFSHVTSYQSLPLNKWVHVTGQLDMSTFTATTTTSYIMIDGVDVPASVTRSGTNPTSLLQAGNLEIGSENGGTLTFPGKIAQVAIYNAKVTQANIRATVSQGLAGTETSLASAYSFDNSIADLNVTTPNDLTAQASAVATNADTPFTQIMTSPATGTTNYGIITSNTFSTNTTLTVQVAEGGSIPTTTGGVSAVSYSSQEAPYGMPLGTNKYSIDCLVLANIVASGSVANTIYNPGGINLNVPIGAWDILGELSWDTNPSSTSITAYSGISTSSSSFSDSDLSTLTFLNNITAGPLHVYMVRVKKRVSLSVATPIYALTRSGVALNTASNLRGVISTTIPEYSKIVAEFAYL